MDKPAIQGGKPVRSSPLPLFDVSLGDEEIDNVLDVLKSRKLVSTHGNWANEFGKLVKEYLGSKYIVMANNGTSTIHLALIALGVGPGDEVICSPLGWISSGTPVLYQNAIPIYADTDSQYGFIDPIDIEKKITHRTKAICVVHTWGLPADLDPILEIGEKHGIPVIEDAAEALGGTYKNKKIGTMGTFGSFSTVWNKIITTGEGGFLISENEELIEKARRFGNFAKVPGRGDYFSGLGYNYRMTELMGALGFAQIKRIDELVTKRRKNAAYLTKQLDSLNIEGLITPKEPKWGNNSGTKGVYWKYTVILEPDKFFTSRDQILKAIQAEGVLSAGPVEPDNLQPFYLKKEVYGRTKCPWECKYADVPQDIDYANMCPTAKVYSDKIIWLTGCSPNLTQNDLDSIVDAVEKVAKWYQT
ncbi:MAG: DegT/DnrJ/EryC1/StrS family aminotransferase [Candidatus Heimdallarchaeota archaeon]